MAWRLAKSLVNLRNEVDMAYPKRSKASDGTIGDPAHQATASDHNPNSKGVVTALDLTHNAPYFNAHKLADKLIVNRHPNLEYVISNRRIAGAWTNWKWVEYNGSNPHDKHIHVSVGDGRPDGQAQGNYDSSQSWGVSKEEDMYKGHDAKYWYEKYNGRGTVIQKLQQQLSHANTLRYAWRDKFRGVLDSLKNLINKEK